jgi:hypothetical protein
MTAITSNEHFVQLCCTAISSLARQAQTDMLTQLAKDYLEYRKGENNL